MKTMEQKHLQPPLASQASSQFLGFWTFILLRYLYCAQGSLLLILPTPFPCFPGLCPPRAMVISFGLLASFTTSLLAISKFCLVQVTVHPTIVQRPLEVQFCSSKPITYSLGTVSFLVSQRATNPGHHPQNLFLMSLCLSVPKFCHCLPLRGFGFSFPSPLPGPQHLWAPCLQVLPFSSLCLSFLHSFPSFPSLYQVLTKKMQRFSQASARLFMTPFYCSCSPCISFFHLRVCVQVFIYKKIKGVYLHFVFEIQDHLEYLVTELPQFTLTH